MQPLLSVLLYVQAGLFGTTNARRYVYGKTARAIRDRGLDHYANHPLGDLTSITKLVVAPISTLGAVSPQLGSIIKALAKAKLALNVDSASSPTDDIMDLYETALLTRINVRRAHALVRTYRSAIRKRGKHLGEHPVELALRVDALRFARTRF